MRIVVGLTLYDAFSSTASVFFFCCLEKAISFLLEAMAVRNWRISVRQAKLSPILNPGVSQIVLFVKITSDGNVLVSSSIAIVAMVAMIEEPAPSVRNTMVRLKSETNPYLSPALSKGKPSNTSHDTQRPALGVRFSLGRVSRGTLCRCEGRQDVTCRGSLARSDAKPAGLAHGRSSGDGPVHRDQAAPGSQRISQGAGSGERVGKARARSVSQSFGGIGEDEQRRRAVDDQREKGGTG